MEENNKAEELSTNQEGKVTYFIILCQYSHLVYQKLQEIQKSIASFEALKALVTKRYQRGSSVDSINNTKPN